MECVRLFGRVRQSDGEPGCSNSGLISYSANEHGVKGIQNLRQLQPREVHPVHHFLHRVSSPKVGAQPRMRQRVSSVARARKGAPTPLNSLESTCTAHRHHHLHPTDPRCEAMHGQTRDGGQGGHELTEGRARDSRCPGLPARAESPEERVSARCGRAYGSLSQATRPPAHTSKPSCGAGRTSYSSRVTWLASRT